MECRLSPKDSGPALIWSLEKLLKFLEHRDVDVRTWASSHILDWYRDAQPEPMSVLPRSDKQVSFFLLDSLRSLPLHEISAAPLREFLSQGSREPSQRALAAALLLRSGASLPGEELASLPLHGVTEVLAGTEAGFRLIQERYGKAADQDEKETLAFGLASCSSSEWVFQTAMEDLEKRKAKTLKQIAVAWGCRLPGPDWPRDPLQARGFLEKALAATARRGPVEGRFPTLLAELEEVRRRCQTLAEDQSATGKGGEARAEAALLATCGLAVYRDEACRRRLQGAKDPADLWSALMMRPWWAEPDPEVVTHLRSQNKAEVQASLDQALQGDWIYPQYGLKCLLAADTASGLRMLLEALESRWGTHVAEGAEDVLRWARPDSEEIILERWRHDPPPVASLWSLELYPTEGVVQLLLHHYEHYITSRDSRLFVEVLGEIAAQEFLEPLVREWRPGETALGSTIELLSLLHEVSSPQIREIVRDTAERMGHLRDPGKVKAKDLLELEPPWPLRCTACGRTYHYKISKVYLDAGTEDLVIGEIVQCKGCGAIERHEEVPGTRLAKLSHLSKGIAAIGVAPKEERKDMADRILPKRVAGIKAAGRTFKNVSEAYHFLREALERDASSADLNKRMGNVLDNGGRPDLALPYYREAVRLDPEEPEANFRLAQVYVVDQKRFDEAVPYVENLARLLRDKGMPEDLRRDLFGGLMELTLSLQEKGRRVEIWPRVQPGLTREEIERETAIVHLFSWDLSKPEDFEEAYRLFLHGGVPERGPGLTRDFAAPMARPSPPTRFQRLGRNDPCPCGSGKKYRRCCGSA